MFTEQPPSPIPATDETARKPARRRKTAGLSAEALAKAGDKRPPSKKRSQPKTTRRPVTPPTVDPQPLSMPPENHEQPEAAERETARHNAERQEDLRREQARHTEALAKAAAHMQALARHRRAMDAVDERERQALAAFDTHRRTWPGVVIAIVRGRQHFDTQRKAITDRHEAERTALRRAFTAPRKD